MNELYLDRFHEIRDGTPGILTANYGGGRMVRFRTIEQHDHQNQPGISRIPAGRYKLGWHGSIKYPVSWFLTGGTVSRYPARDTDRSAILIHKANWSHQLQGCIAIGEQHIWMPDKTASVPTPRLGVSYSGRSVRKLREILGKGIGWEIVIADPPGTALAS